MYCMIRQTRRPCLAFKILAAGAIQPRAAFPYAFTSGADFILGLKMPGNEGVKGGIDPDEAERIYRALLEWKPNEDRAHYLLGNLLARQKRWKDALKEYRLVVRFRGDGLGDDVAAQRFDFSCLGLASHQVDCVKAMGSRELQDQSTYDRSGGRLYQPVATTQFELIQGKQPGRKRVDHRLRGVFVAHSIRNRYGARSGHASLCSRQYPRVE